MPKLENSRQLIIEKTAPVFNQKGYEGTTLSDIKAATGLTKGAVYCNFKDKHELALAVLDFNLNKLKTAVNSHVESQDHAVDKLLGYVTFYQSLFEQVLFVGGCPILNSATDTDDTHPELFSRVKSGLMLWRDHVISIIESGKKAGQIKEETDAGAFADVLISLIEGGILLSKTLRSKTHLESNLNLLSGMIADLKV